MKTLLRTDTPLLTAISLFVLALILLSTTYWIGWKKKPVQQPSPAPKPENPENPEQFMLLATSALRSRQIDKARDLAEEGLKLNPEDKRIRASLLNIIGNTFASARSIDKASRYFIESIQTDPTFAFPHGNLGNLLLLRKEFAQAEKEFKTALQLNPRYPDAYNNLGILYKNQKKYDLAIKAFDDALKLDPHLKVAHENLKAIQKLSEPPMNTDKHR